MSNLPSVDALPQELMDNITSRLFRQDISRLSKTCSKIRAATLKAMFENVEMIWKSNGHFINEMSQFEVLALPRVDFLLRTILETPRFADFVRQINLQASGYRWGDYSFIKPSLPAPLEADVDIIKAAITRIGVSMSKELYIAIEENNIDAVISLLLLTTPRLSSLTLGLDLIRENAFLPDILVHALFSPPSARISQFSNLTRIKIGADHASEVCLSSNCVKFLGESLDIECYVPFFSLPNLLHIEMNLPDVVEDDFESHPQVSLHQETLWPVLDTEVNQLTTLILRRALASPWVLSDVLSRTPHLRKLEYDYINFWNTSLDSDVLASALINVQHTLVHLSLPMRGWNAAHVDSDEDHSFGVYRYCSLKDMVALETLDINTLILLGWDVTAAPSLSEVLPPNLTNVRLRGECFNVNYIEWDQKDIMNSFAQFIEHEHWKIATPLLRYFGLLWEGWAAKDMLKRLCNNNRLVCYITDKEGTFPLPEEDEQYF